MPLLEELRAKSLKAVAPDQRRDRSSANTNMAGADVLADEAERWKYFFESGCASWFDAIKEYTFASSFVDLNREEAKVIVDHWEDRRRIGIAAQSGVLASSEAETQIEGIFHRAMASLAALIARLEVAVSAECAASSAGRAFVKLSTRSPKDSRKALCRARAAYEARLAELEESVTLNDNERWKILSEEVTRAGAVTSATQAVELLLDSERVFEDLEYALRGPKVEATDTEKAPGAQTLYDMKLVARSWDPRITLHSEFRGIAWNSQLTCLCQYFHPLYFPELLELKTDIEADCRALFAQPAVQVAVNAVGGNCIIDFAWLAKGEVIIVELNPFDGVCLGTFPASTGLFLWDNEQDRAVMKGEQPFETRIRDVPLAKSALMAQCNADWRRIIYNETSV